MAQAILGFSRMAIEYCAKCNIRYNKTSRRDISFHDKIHKRPRIPKSLRLSENFYNKRTKYYYGKHYIEACCNGSVYLKTYTVTYLHYETAKAKDILLSGLEMVYKHVKFDLVKQPCLCVAM